MSNQEIEYFLNTARNKGESYYNKIYNNLNTQEKMEIKILEYNEFYFPITITIILSLILIILIIIAHRVKY